MRVALAFLLLVAGASVAHAYPQWQLARDTTCSSCHLAPDGGGLLNENGLATADAVAWLDHDSSFLYGKVTTPEWLTLGGDLRGAGGIVNNRDMNAAFYPMQAEVSATAKLPSGFSVHALGGFRRPSSGASALHVLWSREHYVMWEQRPREGRGLFVRAGRMMPTFGLRLAEHIAYTQRYGGRPLWHEAYAASVSYIETVAEMHVTAFARDRLGTAAERGDGAAIYTEARVSPRLAVGAEGKYSKSDDQTRTFGGIVGKLYIPAAELLLLGEAQLIRQHIDVGDFKTTQLATYVLASKPLARSLQLDLGYGHFVQDTRVKGLYRDAFDANLHWYLDSHIELLVTTRLELVGFGDGGPPGGYALGQLHVRL